MKNDNKLDVKKTLLLSFGFFATSIAWSLYNSFVPQILEKFLQSTAMIGFIMTIDNIFGVIFQPLFGQLSDRTRTRIGRRMPYIVVGLPICAATFVLIPLMDNLWSLMAVIIIFTFAMSAWRSPVVALMPDIIPGPQRSQANGIVNLMGGIGSLLAFLVGGILFNIGGFPLPFLMSAVMMLLALAVMAAFVREPKHAYDPDADKTKAKVKLDKSERKSLIFILAGVFFWFTGYNAVETFFTLYATNTLGISGGDAAMTLAFFSVAFIAFAVPAGFIGAKFGRRNTIIVGLLGNFLLFLPMIFTGDIWTVRICLLIGGVFWALVNINSLPMVVKISGEEKIGSFIGYYYFFSFSSQIVSPILFGYIRDVVGHYRVLFAYACAAFMLAVVSLLFVRHGEDKADEFSAAEVLENLGD